MAWHTVTHQNRTHRVLYPTPPTGASQSVQEAYHKGLSRNRIGLTSTDLRMLQRGVRRGDLVYQADLNMPGKWMYWIPVVYVEQQEAT